MAESIMLVEDETSIRETMAEFLAEEGFEILQAADGLEALEVFRENQPDLIILDLMLPKLDGLEVCKAIRQKSNVPIIMVTARDEEIDKLLGLELGADDYITKPFSLREMKARIKAVLRRTGFQGSTEEHKISFGALEINTDRREVRMNNKIIELTPSEYAILTTLSQNVGRTVFALAIIKRDIGRKLRRVRAGDRYACVKSAQKNRAESAKADLYFDSLRLGL